MSIIITYEKYTLKVLSVTKVKELITESEVTCNHMCRTLITNDSSAYYIDAVGGIYLNREFTLQWGSN